MKAYKLTDQIMQTYNNTQWEIGVMKETSGSGGLCSAGWLHYYSDPLLAVFLNPTHADIKNPRLFEIKAEGKIKNDRGLKFGCTKMTLVKEIPLPNIADEQKIKFCILCALEVCKNKKFVKWAQNWLDGTDRTYDSASKVFENVSFMSPEYYAVKSVMDAFPYISTNAACNIRKARKKKQIDLIKLAKKAMET